MSLSQHYTDAHCHLADERFALAPGGLDGVLARAGVAGVDCFIQGGVDPADWRRQLELTSRYGDRIVPVFGFHPWRVAALAARELPEARAEIDTALSALEEMIPHAFGVGEIGLDFGRTVLRGKRATADATAEEHIRQLQREAFSRQLDLACRVNKPVVLHVVRAHAEVISILRARPPSRGGLVHAFSGGVMEARAYVDLGFLISLGARAIWRPEWSREIISAFSRDLLLDRIVVESDAPDQAPVRGQSVLNEPTSIIAVMNALPLEVVRQLGDVRRVMLP